MTINSKNQPLQAAVYGVGLCAEYGGSVFKPLLGGRWLCSCLVYLFYFYSFVVICLYVCGWTLHFNIVSLQKLFLGWIW
jgi:hypothetical protein